MNNSLTQLGVVLITVYFIGLSVLQVIYEESFQPGIFLVPWLLSITIYTTIAIILKKYDISEKN